MARIPQLLTGCQLQAMPLILEMLVPLRSGIRVQVYPLSPLLFNKVLEVLPMVIREEKEIKSPDWKEVKLFLFEGGMT